MQKIYVRPEIEEVVLEDLMEIVVDSVGQKGSVTGQDDTDWGFGGTPGEDDIVTPTAKDGNLWDTWDD